MTEVILTQARSAFGDRRWDDLRAQGEAALQVVNPDPVLLCDVGNACRDARLFDLSDRIFDKLIHERPDSAFAFYEQAASYILQNRPGDAVQLLDDFLPTHPNDRRVQMLQHKALHLHGEHARADELLAGLTVDADWRGQARLQNALGAFLQAYPIARARQLITEVNAVSPMSPVWDVAERLMQAKRDRSPFSLIRLGDGEGTCIRLNTLDECRYEGLYADNRDQFRRYWFGERIAGFEERFERTVGGLSAAIRDADVVGLPLPGWVEHEYATGSSRGISSLVNVYRLIQGLQASRPILACAQSVHIELGGADFFDGFLRGEHTVGLISCFPQLPERLRRRFDIRKVDFHKIPGEQHFKEMIGAAATRGRHFPYVYNSIVRRIRRAPKGRIYLIAAGILGKLYAHEVKLAGGIALDIGSLADAWVKKPTRPGYETLDEMAL